MNMLPLKDRVEIGAEAMWKRRWCEIDRTATWDDFTRNKPDIAQIYRDNARVVIDALASAGKQ